METLQVANASVDDDFAIVIPALMKDAPKKKKVKSSSDHRASCHRCGNMRKNVLRCTMCPYIFCKPCTDKMQEEHGVYVFVNGCPVCKNLCCCGPHKSISCDRLYHCYKKCPASRSIVSNDLSSKQIGPENVTRFSSPFYQSDNLDSPEKTGRSSGRKRKVANSLESSKRSRKLKFLSNSTSAEMYCYPTSSKQNYYSSFRNGNDSQEYFGSTLRSGVPLYVGNDSCFFDDISPSPAISPGFSLEAPLHENSDTESEISLPIDAKCPASISDAGDAITENWAQDGEQNCQCGAVDPSLCPWNQPYTSYANYANYGACIRGVDGTPCDDCRQNYETCTEGPDGAACEDCRRLCGFSPIYPNISSAASADDAESSISDAAKRLCPACYPNVTTSWQEAPQASLPIEECHVSLSELAIPGDGVDQSSIPCPQCVDGMPCEAAVNEMSLSNYSYCMEINTSASKGRLRPKLSQAARGIVKDNGTAPDRQESGELARDKSNKKSLPAPPLSIGAAATATEPETRLPNDTKIMPNPSTRKRQLPADPGTRTSARIRSRVEKRLEEEHAAEVAAPAVVIALRPRRANAKPNRSLSTGTRGEECAGREDQQPVESTPSNTTDNCSTVDGASELTKDSSKDQAERPPDASPEKTSTAIIAGSPATFTLGDRCFNDVDEPSVNAATESVAEIDHPAKNDDISKTTIHLPPQTPTVEDSPWTQALRAPPFEPHEYPLGMPPDFVISQLSPSPDLGHLSTPIGAVVSLDEMIVTKIHPDGLSMVDDDDLNAVAGALCGLGADTFHMNFVSPPRTAFEAPDAVEVAKELDAWYSVEAEEKSEKR